MGGQRHAVAALPPGKTRYPLCRRLGGPQGRSGRVRKNLAPTGIRSPDRPAHSQSLYRLSYRSPVFGAVWITTVLLQQLYCNNNNNNNDNDKYCAKGSGKEVKIQEFMYRDTTNVEPEMYGYTSNNWSHW